MPQGLRPCKPMAYGALVTRQSTSFSNLLFPSSIPIQGVGGWGKTQYQTSRDAPRPPRTPRGVAESWSRLPGARGRGRAECAQTADLAWQILQTYHDKYHMFSQTITSTYVCTRHRAGALYIIHDTTQTTRYGFILPPYRDVWVALSITHLTTLSAT